VVRERTPTVQPGPSYLLVVICPVVWHNAPNLAHSLKDATGSPIPSQVAVAASPHTNSSTRVDEPFSLAANRELPAKTPA
jgi:hypothetical protein